MKRITIAMAALVTGAVLAFACSGKKETEASTDASQAPAVDSAAVASSDDEWPAMDEFHMIMAEAFHPYKDSANLEPAKAQASTLAANAEKWANAPLPEKVNNDDVKAKLQALKAETAAFATTVKGGDNKAIGEALTKLHDQFHAIQEAWYGGGDGHHHEHH